MNIQDALREVLIGRTIRNVVVTTAIDDQSDEDVADCFLYMDDGSVLILGTEPSVAFDSALTFTTARVGGGVHVRLR